MKKNTLIRILLLMALLLMPTMSIQAQSSNNNDVLLFGENYTLGEGETLNGSIAVFGGNITIEKDAEVNGSIAIFGGNIFLEEETTVNGDIAVFGGSASVTGEVNGDMALFGGQATLGSDSSIDNIATFGGQVTQEPGATVSGEITNNTPPTIDAPEVPSTPNVPNNPDVNFNVNPFWEILSTFGRAVAVAAIGMLLTLFLQPQLDRAGAALINQPFIAGGYGLIAIIVVPVVAVILAITIILIPVSLIAVMALPLAWLFGVIVIGQEVGDRFAKAINQVWAPVLSTGLGTFVIVLLSGLVGLIPCVGWLGSSIITLLAIGVTVLTRFGTFSPMSYPPAASTPSMNEIPPAS